MVAWNCFSPNQEVRFILSRYCVSAAKGIITSEVITTGNRISSFQHGGRRWRTCNCSQFSLAQIFFFLHAPLHPVSPTPNITFLFIRCLTSSQASLALIDPPVRPYGTAMNCTGTGEEGKGVGTKNRTKIIRTNHTNMFHSLTGWVKVRLSVQRGVPHLWHIHWDCKRWSDEWVVMSIIVFYGIFFLFQRTYYKMLSD